MAQQGIIQEKTVNYKLIEMYGNDDVSKLIANMVSYTEVSQQVLTALF